MTFKCQAESGLQFLARLCTRPTLNGLDKSIFSNGPNLQDVIEVKGNLSSGKTLLLTQFLVKCLLPKNWQQLYIGGLECGAIIINTDHHFQLLKLTSLMESWLKHCKLQDTPDSENTAHTPKRLDSKTIEKIIKESLKNLVILNCHDSVQLMVTFYSLGKVLSVNKQISLILIDSISAYYWQDVMIGGIRKMDLYVKHFIKTLQKCVHEFKVTIIYTKQSSFQSQIPEIECGYNHIDITYKIQLNRVETKGKDDLFFAEIESVNGKKIQSYTINPQGIVWLQVDRPNPT